MYKLLRDKYLLPTYKDIFTGDVVSTSYLIFGTLKLGIDTCKNTYIHLYLGNCGNIYKTILLNKIHEIDHVIN